MELRIVLLVAEIIIKFFFFLRNLHKAGRAFIEFYDWQEGLILSKSVSASHGSLGRWWYD